MHTFDASNYLDSEKSIAEYPTPVLQNPDPDALTVVVHHLAKVFGIINVAAQVGSTRKSLYKTLKPGVQPRFSTVRRLLRALDVKLKNTTPPQANT